MNTFFGLAHNGNLVRKAEDILNSLIDLNTENHKLYLYIENPDGTTVRLQKGFRIKDYEIVYFETK